MPSGSDGHANSFKLSCYLLLLLVSYLKELLISHVVVEQKVKQVSTLFSHKFRDLYSSKFSSPVQMRDSKHAEHASWIILRPLNSDDPGVTVNDKMIM